MTEEEEFIEIHGREGRTVEFNQNEQEGIYLGARSTSGNCPSLQLVLTEYRVYAILEDAGDVVCRQDINFKFDDDGEPIGPKDGAVEDAIKSARGKMDGFMRGWSARHNRGPEYDTLHEFADEIKELSCIEEAKVKIMEEKIVAEVYLKNLTRGSASLPIELVNWLDEHPTLEIVDLTDINKSSLLVFIDRDPARARNY